MSDAARGSSSDFVATRNPESFFANRDEDAEEAAHGQYYVGELLTVVARNFSTMSFQLSGPRAILVFSFPSLALAPLLVTPRRNARCTTMIHLFEFRGRIARFFHMVVHEPKNWWHPYWTAGAAARRKTFPRCLRRWCRPMRRRPRAREQTDRPLVRAIACFMRPRIILTSSLLTSSVILDVQTLGMRFSLYLTSFVSCPVVKLELFARDFIVARSDRKEGAMKWKV